MRIGIVSDHESCRMNLMPSLLSWYDILDDAGALDLLLKTKDAVNGLDEYGATLLDAAIDKRRWDIVKFALEQGAVNVAEAYHNTPLMNKVSASNTNDSQSGTTLSQNVT
jgi:hypothetical protein